MLMDGRMRMDKHNLWYSRIIIERYDFNIQLKIIVEDDIGFFFQMTIFIKADIDHVFF